MYADHTNQQMIDYMCTVTNGDFLQYQSGDLIHLDLGAVTLKMFKYMCKISVYILS